MIQALCGTMCLLSYMVKCTNVCVLYGVCDTELCVCVTQYDVRLGVYVYMVFIGIQG